MKSMTITSKTTGEFTDETRNTHPFIVYDVEITGDDPDHFCGPDCRCWENAKSEQELLIQRLLQMRPAS